MNNQGLIACQRCGYRWHTKSERPYVSCPYCLTKVKNPRGKIPAQLAIDEIREKVIPILKRHGVKKAGIFGSVIRGEARRGSDVDILVEIGGKRVSLLDLVGLEMELEEALGRKVDLGEYCAIKPLAKERILSEEVRIYEG